MKRYSLPIRPAQHGGGYDLTENPNGTWVRHEDVEHAFGGGELTTEMIALNLGRMLGMLLVRGNHAKLVAYLRDSRQGTRHTEMLCGALSAALAEAETP